MKTKLNQLIKALGGTPCGCKQCKPIGIAEVLERLEFAENQFMVKGCEDRVWRNNEELLELWANCGFTKPLQELAECEWEEVEDTRAYSMFVDSPVVVHIEVPKPPEVRALVQFLLELNLVEL